jgi:hypothetical protein
LRHQEDLQRRAEPARTSASPETNWDALTWALREGDGTAAGTHYVRTFVGAPAHAEQTAVGGRLFFAADDEYHGEELWRYAP